jgi:hypothetical protein
MNIKTVLSLTVCILTVSNLLLSTLVYADTLDKSPQSPMSYSIEHENELYGWVKNPKEVACTTKKLIAAISTAIKYSAERELLNGPSSWSVNAGEALIKAVALKLWLKNLPIYLKRKGQPTPNLVKCKVEVNLPLYADPNLNGDWK